MACDVSPVAMFIFLVAESQNNFQLFCLPSPNFPGAGPASGCGGHPRDQFKLFCDRRPQITSTLIAPLPSWCNILHCKTFVNLAISLQNEYDANVKSDLWPKCFQRKANKVQSAVAQSSSGLNSSSRENKHFVRGERLKIKDETWDPVSHIKGVQWKRSPHSWQGMNAKERAREVGDLFIQCPDTLKTNMSPIYI